MITNLTSNDMTLTNSSQSFTHKMVVKTSWHKYGARVRCCQPGYVLKWGLCALQWLLV